MIEPVITPTEYRVAVPPSLSRGRLDLTGRWDVIHPPQQASRKPTKSEAQLPAYAIQYRGAPAIYLITCRAESGPKADAHKVRLADAVALADHYMDESFLLALESVDSASHIHKADQSRLKDIAHKHGQISPGPWRIYRPSEGGLRVVQGEAGYLFDIVADWRETGSSQSSDSESIGLLVAAAENAHRLAERAVALASKFWRE